MKTVRWHFLIIAAACGVVATNGAAYLHAEQPPVYCGRASQEQTSPAAATIWRIAALGRIAPDGEIVHVSSGAVSSVKIAKLLVHENQHVCKGTNIAILEGLSVDLAELESARKSLEAAQSRVAQLQSAPKKSLVAEADATIARLQNEQELAERDCARYARLYQEGAISADQYDLRLTAAASKKRAVEEERALRDSLFEVRPSDLAVARSEVSRAESQLHTAQEKADLDVIKAPMTGSILKIHTREGERENPSGIVEMGATESMNAIAEVYESDACKLRLGAPVTIYGDSFKGNLTGTVIHISHEVGKQSILDNEPSADVDSRIVETWIRFSDQSLATAKNLTNARVHVLIGVQP